MSEVGHEWVFHGVWMKQSRVSFSSSAWWILWLLSRAKERNCICFDRCSTIASLGSSNRFGESKQRVNECWRTKGGRGTATNRIDCNHWSLNETKRNEAKCSCLSLSVIPIVYREERIRIRRRGEARRGCFIQRARSTMLIRPSRRKVAIRMM